MDIVDFLEAWPPERQPGFRDNEKKPGVKHGFGFTSEFMPNTAWKRWYIDEGRRKRATISKPSEFIKQKAVNSDACLGGWQDYSWKRGYYAGTDSQRSLGQ